jgi:hypothetical protein
VITGSGVRHEVGGAEFGKAILCGAVEETALRTGSIRPGYCVYLDHQTGVLQFALAETPRRDFHTRRLRSWWYLLFRHAIFVGTPNATLYSYAAQVECIEG